MRRSSIHVGGSTEKSIFVTAPNGTAAIVGWAHVVCVAAPGRVPAVIERRRVALIDAGLPTQPYEHDSITVTGDAANALIVRVRRSIAARASDALTRMVTDLAPAYAIVASRSGSLHSPSFLKRLRPCGNRIACSAPRTPPDCPKAV